MNKDCDGCTDCSDCRDCVECKGCLSCLGCTGCVDCCACIECHDLTGKTDGYWVRNEQVTEDVFNAALREYNRGAS